MKNEKLLNKIQKELDKNHMHSEVFVPYENKEHPYIECTKDPKPVKELLKSMNIEIANEYESSGSDYDSYIIELNL